MFIFASVILHAFGSYTKIPNYNWCYSEIFILCHWPISLFLYWYPSGINSELYSVLLCLIWLLFTHAAAAAAKWLQSCPTLCNPIDSSPLGSPVPGILQARTLELVAISFSNAWKWKVKVKLLSPVLTLSDPMDCSLPGCLPSLGFSGQQYWSGVPLPSPYSLIGFPFLLVSWLFLHVCFFF